MAAVVQDAAGNDIIDVAELLTADELAAAAALPFKAPSLDKVDLGSRDVDEKTDAAVQASYRDAAHLLEEQIRACTRPAATTSAPCW